MGPGGAQEKAPFGLVGHPLGHSWSPQIHAQLGSVPYELHDLAEDEARAFIAEGTWRGLNVTIPYKRLAAELADELSLRVERLGVANTLVRRPDGAIFAENTDVLGFSWMLERFCRTRLGTSARKLLEGRTVLVLGSGGAAQAVRAALEDEQVGAHVVTISRSGDETYATLAERHADAALVVNTTPVGMYPACPASPITDETLAALPHLLGVLDVVYNPLRTGICLAAERLGVPSESGLAMLVAQALRSSELFQGQALDEGLIDSILAELRRQSENIVLIGMPGAGKSSCGRHLASRLGREFVDIDDAIVATSGRSPEEIIREDGEAAFRSVETSVTGEHAARSGLVIACGGGVVTQPGNYPLLHQNSTIVLLDRPLEQLSVEGRPVSQEKGVERLYAERMERYRAWADLVVACTGSAEGDAELIAARLGLS